MLTTKKNSQYFKWLDRAASIWHAAVDPEIKEMGNRPWVFDPGPDYLRGAFAAGWSAEEVGYYQASEWFKYRRTEE